VNIARARIYKQNIESNPLHQFLGLRIDSVGEGEARVTIPINGHTLNQAGGLHEGIIHLVADVAAFAAIGPSLDNNEFPVTLEIQCRIYKETGNGPIFFKSKIAGRIRKMAFINVEVSDGYGNLVAEAKITKNITDSVPQAFW
jgi:uncharacterized protein (TIGR00369 family)